MAERVVRTVLAEQAGRSTPTPQIQVAAAVVAPEEDRRALPGGPVKVVQMVAIISIAPLRAAQARPRQHQRAVPAEATATAPRVAVVVLGPLPAVPQRPLEEMAAQVRNGTLPMVLVEVAAAVVGSRPIRRQRLALLAATVDFTAGVVVAAAVVMPAARPIATERVVMARRVSS